VVSILPVLRPGRAAVPEDMEAARHQESEMKPIKDTLL
jgi:hypothetical protein